MERTCVTYSMRFQDSIPCNVLWLSVFFATFIVLDHVRGLVCLLGVLLIMPLHHNKHEVSHASKLVGMCTSQPGTHHSCSAVYFWCTLSGFQEALAASLYSEFSWTRVVLLVIMWSSTAVTACLFYDSHSVSYKKPQPTEKPASSSSRAPLTVLVENVGRAPD